MKTADERRLIHPDDYDHHHHNNNDGADDDVHGPSFSSSHAAVVGVIPPSVYDSIEILRRHDRDDHEDERARATSCHRTLLHGGIDRDGSGLSYLFGSADGARGGMYGDHDDDDDDREDDHVRSNGGNVGNVGNTVYLWEHAIQTLADDLIPPSGHRTLVHPEHSSSHPLRVACLDRPSPSNGARDVYVASPASGVICLWTLRRGHREREREPEPERECDASIRLPLAEGERLTALVPLPPSEGTAVASSSSSDWMLVGTSLGRIWRMTKTARPLSLSAKAVKRRWSSREGDGGREERETRAANSGGGWYEYLFSSSDRDSHREGDSAAIVERESTSTSTRDSPVLALLPLPDIGRRPPEADAAPSQPSPWKRARTSDDERAPSSSSSSLSSPHARVLAIHDDPHLTFREYRVSTSAAPRSDSDEGCRMERRMAPRSEDGSLDLREWGASNPASEDGPRTFRTVDVVAPPKLTGDGRSVVLAVRLQGGDDDDKEEVEVEARLYLLRIALNTYTVVDAAWLDRYSGEFVSEIGGSWDCAGLVVGDANDDDDDDHDDGYAGRGAVAYVALGPQPELITSQGTSPRGRVPVTVTAVHFSPLLSENDRTHPPKPVLPPRIRDLDLFEHLVPALVADSMSYDSTTGGCLFLSTAGLVCGAHVRFPSMMAHRPGGGRRRRDDAFPTDALEGRIAGRAPDDFDLEASFRDDAVVTVKSHLLSSFRQYLARIRDGGANPALVARSVAPPSIRSCTSSVLSAAAVLASLSIIHSAKAGTTTTITTTMAANNNNNNNSVTALRDKLRWHSDFLKFLLHAGAYKKVSPTGRTKLRDHGEIIAAAQATLAECRQRLAYGADAGDETATALRRKAMEALAGTSDIVADLPRRWDDLQRLVGPDPNQDSMTMKTTMMMLALSCVCRGIGEAFRYRAEESNSLYDIPPHDPTSRGKGTIPWTSSREVLAVLSSQLENLQRWGDAVLSASSDYEQDKMAMKGFVEDVSMSLLAGYHDHFRCEPHNEEVARSYDEAKRLAVSLLRVWYVNEDGDDLKALDMSLKHSFFEGIVQICHDHRRSWKFHGPFSPVVPDETYDIRIMLSGTSPDSPYVHLHDSTDYGTGLPFCDFVLHWYADRGSKTEVLELGKECPGVLTRFLRNDNRFSDLAWIHDLRIGAHDRAADTLANLTSSILPGRPANTPMDLWEKEQMMSLAKLSNKLARSKNPDSAVVARNVPIIEKSLNLVEAQRILEEDNLEEDGSKAILPSDELIVLAANKINSARDLDSVKKYALCGLAIAHAMSSEDINAMVHSAATVWEACIQSDIHTWSSLARENSMSVTGISYEDLSQRVQGTAFVGINGEFATSSGGSMQGVGFLSNVHVRRRVLESLGSNEDLGKLLVRSAEMVSG